MPQDHESAAKLFKGACDRGIISGCLFLGLLHENGEGVKKDIPRARALFKKACDGKFKSGCDSYKRLSGKAP